eukprot:TRINITY_DN13036_c0_g1_i3.p1 TRINITY_DN13036_c0_g1~~TRINITY_DN13036_c0_g1_i3.p1  ORF type:complete len:669 (+),score=116.69 TRINITY_DN13036_c0_g1_i3:70-2076(+)
MPRFGALVGQLDEGPAYTGQTRRLRWHELSLQPWEAQCRGTRKSCGSAFLSTERGGRQPRLKQAPHSLAVDAALPRARGRRGVWQSFLEDSFEHGAESRIRADVKLAKAEGGPHEKPEHSSAPPEPEEPEQPGVGEVVAEQKRLVNRLDQDLEGLIKAVKEEDRQQAELAAVAAVRKALSSQKAHHGTPHHHHVTVTHVEPAAEAADQADQSDPCTVYKDAVACQDIEKHCSWKGDASEGSCHRQVEELWPTGQQFWLSVAEVLALEGVVVLTAVATRKGGREMLRSLGYQRPGYSLRAAAWFYPTVLMYALTGMYYYTRTQGWSAFDTLYFLAQVVSTVGVGDMSPVQPMPKLFTVGHVLIGLVLIGGAVGDEVDKIMESRLVRMTDAISRGADFQELLPTLWRVAAETRQACGSLGRFQDLIKRLDELPVNPRDTMPTQEHLRWLRDAPGGRVIGAELLGGGALIQWPDRGTQLWASAGWRLKVLLPLLKYVEANQDAPMPTYDEEATLALIEDDNILDEYYEDLLYRSTYDVSVVIGTGTVFFGVVDNWLRGKHAFSLFDGFYFAVAAASSVGMSGDVTAITSVEKAVCIWLFCYGAYSFNRFMMFASELFAYKVENSQKLVSLLPEGPARAWCAFRQRPAASGTLSAQLGFERCGIRWRRRPPG